jgi:nitrite reductase/ring-hydroxylating ferredoxin subunit
MQTEIREVYAVCGTEAIKPGGAKAFSLSRLAENGEPRPYSIVIVRPTPYQYRGYMNACPHAGVWLNVGTGEFFTPDRAFLRCGRHGAKFDIATGHCIEGPCEGARLISVDLVVCEGDVCLSGVKLVEDDRVPGDFDDEYDETMEIMIHPG